MSTTKVNADVLDLTDDYAFTGTVTGAGGGVVVQVVNTQTGAVATGTTQLPNDDTIPQNNEGNEYMTLAITPTSASNKLLIEVSTVGSAATGHMLGVALFQDSTAGAIASSTETFATNELTNVSYSHYMTSGATSSTTFKVRMGVGTSTTTTFNGNAGGRFYGGLLASSITITEISV